MDSIFSPVSFSVQLCVLSISVVIFHFLFYSASTGLLASRFDLVIEQAPALTNTSGNPETPYYNHNFRESQHELRRVNNFVIWSGRDLLSIWLKDNQLKARLDSLLTSRIKAFFIS